MVHNTQNYCVFGLCPSSGILETRKHNASETGSVSVLSWGGEDTYLVDNPCQIHYSYILVPSICVLYHNFYCIFSCYLRPNLPSLMWLNGCVNLTGVVQWLKLAFSKGPNRVGVSPHVRTETDPVSETLCFLVYRIPDDGQSPKKSSNSECL
jgi:hypothetical protein